MQYPEQVKFVNVESNSDIKVTYNLSLTSKTSSVELKILHLGLFTIFNVHLIITIFREVKYLSSLKLICFLLITEKLHNLAEVQILVK